MTTRTARTLINSGSAPALPYSRAVVSGGIIHLSGTIADADPGGAPAGDAGGQTRAVIERMRGVLEDAGSSLADVVSVTVYLASASDFAAMNDHDKHAARVTAREQLEGRFRDLIQRRHDCIHNCDRPRVSPQPLSTASTVLKVIHVGGTRREKPLRIEGRRASTDSFLER